MIKTVFILLLMINLYLIYFSKSRFAMGCSIPQIFRKSSLTILGAVALLWSFIYLFTSFFSLFLSFLKVVLISVINVPRNTNYINLVMNNKVFHVKYHDKVLINESIAYYIVCITIVPFRALSVESFYDNNYHSSFTKRTINNYLKWDKASVYKN